MEHSTKRRASCECGSCSKCKNRKRAAELRASSETYRRNQAAAARDAYRSLSVEQRKARSAKRAEYQRQYRQENQDRIKELQAKRREAKSREISAKSKEYYQKNAGELKARALARYRANPKASIDRAAEWNRANSEKKKKAERKWRAKAARGIFPGKLQTISPAVSRATQGTAR